jgi:RNA polymerase sigma-70 factor (ECF subfamily)
LVLEDRLLVWKLKHGSSEALRQIYEICRDDLLKVAVALLNDTAVAEDIVHDVFISFARSAQQFQLTGTLKGYLATCVANRARNANKAGRIRQPAELNEADLEAQNCPGPERWIIHCEEMKRVTDALSQLPYEQREVISLHIQAGLKFSEIAKLQAVPIKTAQSRFRYGLSKLRSLLNSEVEK